MRLENATLNHVYGIAGLIPGIIGLGIALKVDAPWSEYALLASGWLTALFYALMLVRAFNIATADGEEKGRLREQIVDLEKTLDARSATADYLASLLIGKTGTPRSVASNDPDTITQGDA
jgi:uncharacterized membrane protein HdeD (DUF308 family)